MSSKSNVSTGYRPKVSGFIAASLDGYIARPNGNIDWLDSGSLAEPNEEDYGFEAFMDSVDVLVMGRHTFETVLSFGDWPYGEQRVIVLSSSLTEPPDHLPAAVEVERIEPSRLLHRLADEGVRHVYVDGGETLQRFLRAGAVDEMIISRIPVLIGEGIPLFGQVAGDIWWDPVETRSYDTGLVQTRYRVKTAE